MSKLSLGFGKALKTDLRILQLLFLSHVRECSILE